MESLERFAQNQRVIEEFASRWLAAIPSDLGRLAHVSQLRDVSSGRYRHPILEEDFSEPAIHHALLYCHEELFAKVLELPLEREEADLRSCLAGMDSPASEIAGRWLEVEVFRMWAPLGTPSYLRDLFFSNLRVLLGLVCAEQSKLQTAA
ncbi:MAG: hypothetical protein ACRD4S_07435 [Candidatus Acidiferrales bacterium]